MGIKEKELKLPENHIIISAKNLRIFLKLSRTKPKKSRVHELIGILSEYKDKFSSVELQHKAKDLI